MKRIHIHVKFQHDKFSKGRDVKNVIFARRALFKRMHCQNNLDEDLKPFKESTNFAKHCFKFEIDKQVQNNE